jgi:hypothetical protein
MADDKKPMPQWIKNSLLPESTKQYLYEQWLNGTLDTKAPPQDWGLITDVAEAIRKLTFKKPKIRTDVFPKQSLEQLQQASSEIAQNRNDLRLAISKTDGIDVIFKGETLTLDEAIKQERNLSIVNDQYKNSIERKQPKVKDADPNLQVSLETAQMNSDEAYQTMLQEITTFPETSQPFRDRYFATLKTLDQVETKALNAGLKIPKSVTVNMGLPTRDVTAAPTTAEALRAPVATRPPSGVAAQQGMGATAATPVEDRAEQARFARIKTGELKPGTKTTPTGMGVGAGTDDTGTGGAGAGAGAGATAGGTGGTGVGVAVAPVVDVNKRKAFVTEQLAARGLENTPANREMLRKEYKTTAATATTEQPAAVSTAWETTFRETFPAKAWLLDLDRTKYPGLFKLLNTAISQQWYKSTEGLNRFNASLDATDFYKELSTSKQLKTIQSLVGTLGFEGSDFTKFVSDSINMGYEGDILKQKVYSEVFKKDESGNYVNPTALARTQKSADYISTQNIAKAFFNRNPADSDIEKVLTGQMLASDYERQQREFAKTRYGHLSNLLDQGMTLESIASAYQTTASRLLERNINDIDMSTGAFEQAVSFGEEGKKRLMTNSEWEKLLRSDPQYGWERTNNAKDEARALSANIAQAFGRII